MAGALDGAGQLTLLAFGKSGLFSLFNLSVLVYVALQGLKVLVVKESYVGLMLEYLCHKLRRGLMRTNPGSSS